MRLRPALSFGVVLAAALWVQGACAQTLEEALSAAYLNNPTLAAERAALRGTRLDAALLEETFGTKTDGGEIHLHLETFGRLVDQLRAIEAVTPTTQVVAIHLSHHNPPLADLQEALAEFGALAHPDGTQLRV